MTGAGSTEGQRAAAAYLRELLLKPGIYRDAWQQHVVRPRPGVINQMAVAEVIVGYLKAVPGRTGDACMQAYQLRETVSSALAGRQLSQESLRLFIGAFGFAEAEAERLGRLWNGATSISVIAGSRAVPIQAERQVAEFVGPRRHQTLSLHDHVYVGRDARIDRARMMQVVQATAQGVDRIPFLCDTNVLTIEVGQGGKELTGEVQQIRENVYFTEILLARTLNLGETLTLEYWITYRFPGNFTDPAEREFRRVVMRHIENFDMRIEFHPERLPEKVWWAQWEGLDGKVLECESVTLDNEHSAHRFVRSVDQTAAGFYWQWD